MLELFTVLAGVALVVGIVCTIVPILPGSLIIGGGLIAWAVVVPSTPARIIVAVAVGVLLLTQLVQYLVAGRYAKRSGVSYKTLGLGALLGVVAMFLLPVVGLLPGFVLGVYLSESAIHRDQGKAWQATVTALKAVALSIGIEVTGAVICAALWAGAVAAAWPTITAPAS